MTRDGASFYPISARCNGSIRLGGGCKLMNRTAGVHELSISSCVEEVLGMGIECLLYKYS